MASTQLIISVYTWKGLEKKKKGDPPPTEDHPNAYEIEFDNSDYYSITTAPAVKFFGIKARGDHDDRSSKKFPVLS